RPDPGGVSLRNVRDLRRAALSPPIGNVEARSLRVPFTDWTLERVEVLARTIHAHVHTIRNDEPHVVEFFHDLGLRPFKCCGHHTRSGAGVLSNPPVSWSPSSFNTASRPSPRPYCSRR